MLRAGRDVGIVDGDGIAGQQVGGIDIEAGLRHRIDRSARNGLVRKRLSHGRGEGVELGLRLDQILVAHLQIGRDGSRTDGVVLNQVNWRAVRGNERNRANAALRRIRAPLRSWRNGSNSVKTHVLLVRRQAEYPSW